MTYKAVLIDLDGTLVDSVPALYQAYLKFLEYYKKKGTAEEFQSLIGPSIDEIVDILQKKHELPGTHQSLASVYVSMIVMQGFEGVALYPGADAFIKEAKKNKAKLGLVTSGTRALVKSCLDPLKITDQFDVLVTSEDVKVAKPNPEMYQLALKKLELTPEQAIAIEDSEAGIKAALDAGLKVICVTHPGKEPLTLDEKHKNQVVFLTSWKEIQSWIHSN